MAAKNEPLFQQADSLWKMLDDLAETNPIGYKKLIDKVIKDQKDHWKPPDPVFCFKTAKLPESSNCCIFINICKWNRVSKPKDDEDKLSVIASNVRNLPDNPKHSVIDICFHDDIINKSGHTAQCQQLIASISLDYVEKQTGLKLSKEYKVLNVKYKGNIAELKRYLFSRNFAGDSSKQHKHTSSQSSVLEDISRIVQTPEEAPPRGVPQHFEGLPSETLVRKRDDGKTAKPLIQEVLRKTNVIQKPIPKHSIEVVEATMETPKGIVVKIKLPEIQSGSECELDMSKDDLVLCTSKYSKLQIQLPDQGNKDETTSTFNKTTHELTIMVPLAKP